MYFLCSPYIVSGLSSKKINKKVAKKVTQEFNFITEVMAYLKENNTGTDIIISNVQNYLFSQEDEIKNLCTEIFTNSLKLGVEAKTINKAFGENFIPTFNVMLAEKYFDRPERVEGKEFTITLKLDGVRNILIKENGKVSMFSRQGQVVDGLLDIENEIKNLPLDNFVLDGELLAEVEGLASKDQYRETIKRVRKDGEKHGVRFMVFDCMSITDFKNQKNNDTYIQRRKNLEQFQGLQHTNILPVLYQGNDTSKILELLNEARNNDQEGVILNLNEGVYEFKRTHNLLKVKSMCDCDLRVVGIEEGSGRLAHTLGRLNVNYKGNILGVGSGFSDEMRNEVWNNQDKYMNAIAKIQYFEETTNQSNDLKSLRFPVFMEWRFDKTEESYS